MILKKVSRVLVRLFSGHISRDAKTKKYAKEAIAKYEDTLRKLSHE